MRRLSTIELNGLRWMAEHDGFNMPSIVSDTVYRAFESLEALGLATSEQKHHTIPNHKSRFFITDEGRRYIEAQDYIPIA